VGTERLELSHLTALASKTSVSTNFTTSPCRTRTYKRPKDGWYHTLRGLPSTGFYAHFDLNTAQTYGVTGIEGVHALDFGTI